MAANPCSLYERCIGCFVSQLNYRVANLDTMEAIRYLPVGILIDIYVKMSLKREFLDMLLVQLTDLKMFDRLLRCDAIRQKLFLCIKQLSIGRKMLAAELQQNFTMRYQLSVKTLRSSSKFPAAKSTAAARARNNSTQQTNAESARNLSNSNSCKNMEFMTADDDEDNNDIDVEQSAFMPPDAIDFGLKLGSFLADAGFMKESILVLDCLAKQLRRMPTDGDMKLLIVRLDCLQRLLHAEAALCNFKTAERTYEEIVQLMKEMVNEEIPNSLLAKVYTQFSAMYFARSEYDDSNMWSVLALQHLDKFTPKKVSVDVLRQAAKSCVVKRDFARANLLICQATGRAREFFGTSHQKYGDALLDYGFFLLNVDSVKQSVKVYKQALEIKQNIFGDRNFHAAIAHEDLSYACYVDEYSSGDFACARAHVERAVEIMQEIVPSDHLMLASAKRVKALLLEEIALDKMLVDNDEEGLLQQSEDLHKFALQLSLEAFGENNVQTAKHYGNLGRLYQTMSRFDEAERMHQKAIKIKTAILGPYDYEVGLSIGHLASLYNYQMKKYTEAEELYLRSIAISLRLFGRTYSGLEYDYLGLCNVYDKMREYENYLKYADILECWQGLRSENKALKKTSYPAILDVYTLEDVKHQFFNMSSQIPAAEN